MNEWSSCQIKLDFNRLLTLLNATEPAGLVDEMAMTVNKVCSSVRPVRY